MSTILAASPGQVVRVNTGRSAIPFKINLPGFPTRGAIVTSAAMQQSGNFQFLHTLQEFIYIYVFGDKVGSLVVSGVAFMDKCAGSNRSGVEDALQYYGNRRIAGSGDPVRVGFGNIPFQCFLTDGSFEVKDSGVSGTLGFFTLNFRTFPNRRIQS